MGDRLSTDARVGLFERMALMRRFEEEIIHAAAAHKDIGRNHLYIGHEATGAAVLAALRPGDLTHTTHRNHGHLIGRGADPGKALAEIMGRAGGLNGGRGGTWHLCDASVGFQCTSAMVGGSIGLAIGGGYAKKELADGGVSVAFFGDGVLDEGISYEAFNFASRYDLPVLFVCENNSQEGAHETSRLAASALADVPRALGIDIETVNGHDADAVHGVVTDALARVREGRPVFLESHLERWPGSHQAKPEFVTGITDIEMAFDSTLITGKHADWIDRCDPVLLYARTLVDDGAATAEQLRAVDGDVGARIKEARAWAEASPYPDPASALTGVYA